MVSKDPYGSLEVPYTPESQNPMLKKLSDMCKDFCRIFNISLHRIALFLLTSAKIVNKQQKTGEHVENQKLYLVSD